VPAAYLFAQFVSPRVSLIAAGLGHNVYPREDISKASASLPPEKVARLKRQEAAHQNALENFPLFAAAMIIGNDAGLDSGTLNFMGFGYLVTRALYTWFYVNITTEKYSYLRYSLYDVSG